MPAFNWPQQEQPAIQRPQATAGRPEGLSRPERDWEGKREGERERERVLLPCLGMYYYTVSGHRIHTPTSPYPYPYPYPSTLSVPLSNSIELPTPSTRSLPYIPNPSETIDLICASTTGQNNSSDTHIRTQTQPFSQLGSPCLFRVYTDLIFRRADPPPRVPPPLNVPDLACSSHSATFLGTVDIWASWVIFWETSFEKLYFH